MLSQCVTAFVQYVIVQHASHNQMIIRVSVVKFVLTIEIYYQLFPVCYL